VPFYDKDGNIYHFITDLENSRLYFVNTKTKEELPAERCFVDMDGYFVYDEKGEFKQGDSFFTATDKDGKKYYIASLVIWNEDGKLVGQINTTDE